MSLQQAPKQLELAAKVPDLKQVQALDSDVPFAQWQEVVWKPAYQEVLPQWPEIGRLQDGQHSQKAEWRLFPPPKGVQA